MARAPRPTSVVDIDITSEVPDQEEPLMFTTLLHAEAADAHRLDLLAEDRAERRAGEVVCVRRVRGGAPASAKRVHRIRLRSATNATQA
ncbi:MAG: hypothetical protein JO147_11510 [Actinobacteria bacterium]|nr:hypothetical protein [Actinomycetota bacterium]